MVIPFSLIDKIPSLPTSSPSLGITIGVLVGNLGVETTGTQGGSPLTGGLMTSGCMLLS